jgi:hypothetical protein
LLGGLEIYEAAGAGTEKDNMFEACTGRQCSPVEIGRVDDAGIVADEQLGDVRLCHRSHIDADGDVFGLVHGPPKVIDVRR